MKVELAGLNIDARIVRELGEKFPEIKDSLTPETLSASYARISRSKKSIARLREEAVKEVERARKSNTNIIFRMGHASVAEHAAFNFDVTGISRYAVEYIQGFRLVSFTEKSQRYVLFEKEFYIPEEIENEKTRFLRGEYVTVVEKLASIYTKLYRLLIEAGVDDEKAKEDSRYATSLSTLTQFGMTLNARNLEYMIVRLKSSPLLELKRFASSLYESVKDIVPSLVKYVDEDPYYSEFYPEPRVAGDISLEDRSVGSNINREKVYPEVELIDFDQDGEARVIASLLFSMGSEEYKSYYKSYVDKTLQREAKEYLIPFFSKMKAFHPLPRVFEMTSLIFQIELSASAFAQLKRHRMATIIAQSYDPELGFTLPPTVGDAGAGKLIEEAYNISTELFYRLAKSLPRVAPYVLTNAHRRRVVVRLDIRELYHISRLREDIHAQWEIREVARRMVSLAKEKYPLLMSLACGKDAFERTKSGMDLTIEV